MKRRLRKAKSENGQAIVEFALALPLLLLVLCGVLDFGWLYLNSYQADHAANDGARYAALHATEMSAGQLQTAVTERVREEYERAENATVTVTLEADCVSVEVHYPVPTITFVASTLFGRTYDCHATSVYPF